MILADSTVGNIHHPSGLSISSEALAQYSTLRQASTTRAFSVPGDSRLDEFWKMREHLDAPTSFLVFGEQQHTSNVGVVTEALVNKNAAAGYWRFPKTDAIVCSLKNVTVAIQTADCAPVFLYDPVAEVIALTHAGWKGTLSHIVSETVTTVSALGSDPADLIAWVGPMAGGCCYEVSHELAGMFKEEFPEIRFHKTASDRHLDLVDLNCRQLVHSGLLLHNIHRSNICTIHNHDRFYSYRADNGTNGRIISAMVMPQSF